MLKFSEYTKYQEMLGSIDNSPSDFDITFLEGKRFSVTKTLYGIEHRFYINYKNFSYLLENCDIKKGKIKNCVIIEDRHEFYNTKTHYLIPVESDLFSSLSNNEKEKNKVILKDKHVYLIKERGSQALQELLYLKDVECIHKSLDSVWSIKHFFVNLNTCEPLCFINTSGIRSILRAVEEKGLFKGNLDKFLNEECANHFDFFKNRKVKV